MIWLSWIQIQEQPKNGKNLQMDLVPASSLSKRLLYLRRVCFMTFFKNYLSMTAKSAQEPDRLGSALVLIPGSRSASR
jgi:hypothetical protein